MFISFYKSNHFGHRHLEDNQVPPLETFPQPVQRPFYTIRDSGAELEASSSCTNKSHTALSCWLTCEAIPSHQWLGGKHAGSPASHNCNDGPLVYTN